MRRFLLVYSDNTFSDRPDRFEIGPFEGNDAKAMADTLGTLGCKDFEFVPYNEDKEAAGGGKAVAC